MIEAITQLDINILEFIRENMRFGPADFIFTILTHLADPIVAPVYPIVFILIGSIIYYRRHSRGERVLDTSGSTFDFARLGWLLGVALILGLLVCNLTLKPLISRIRPYELDVFRDAVPALRMIELQSEKSFPSGHSVAVFEMAFVTAYYCRKTGHGGWGVFAYAMAVLIAFSRIYVGVHYPSDVAAGAVIGTVCGIIAVLIVNKIYGKLEEKYKVKV